MTHVSIVACPGCFSYEVAEEGSIRRKSRIETKSAYLLISSYICQFRENKAIVSFFYEEVPENFLIAK